MDRRTHESPMDFEWQTSGPVDPTSPFFQLTQKQGQRRGFESPAKTEIIQASNPTSFSTAHSTQAPPPFRNPSFVTPRKPFDQDFFSEASGVDSSPADNADAEDTPDLPKQTKPMTAFTSARPDKKPIFGRYGLNFKGNSPGRGELRRGRYGDAVVQKVRKRKRLERDYALVNHRRGSWDSDSESEAGRYREKNHHRSASGEPPQHTPPPKGWISQLLTGIESRPTLPFILSYYAQLFFNWFVVLFIAYFIWTAWATIRSDVDHASEAEVAEVLAEMHQCATQFTENRCTSDTRPPALDQLCSTWALCMDKDPKAVGRARISAHTFAEIFNSFVEPISMKAFIFIALIVVGMLAINNIAFGMLRSKAAHHYYPPPPQPPPTPHHPQAYDWMAQTPRHPPVSFDVRGQGFEMVPPHSPMQSHSPVRGSPKKVGWH